MDLIEAEKIAEELIHKHLNSKLDYNKKQWVFEFRPFKRFYGQCNYREKKIIVSSILTLLNDKENFIDTVLHEIAHALAPAREHHGRIWKKICIQIGCRPERCYNGEINEPEKKVVYTCPNCGLEVRRHRKTLKDIACGVCCRKFNNGKYSQDFVLQLVA